MWLESELGLDCTAVKYFGLKTSEAMTMFQAGGVIIKKIKFVFCKDWCDCSTKKGLGIQGACDEDPEVVGKWKTGDCPECRVSGLAFLT